MDDLGDSLAANRASKMIRLIRFLSGADFVRQIAPCHRVSTLLSLTNEPTCTATENSHVH